MSRRSFVASASAAIGVAALASNVAAHQADPKELAIRDSRILTNDITFKSGEDTIKAYLARPKREGRYRSVLIAQGNPRISDDIKNAAAELAQAGFVGLAYDWGSIAPMPSDEAKRAQWQN